MQEVDTNTKTHNWLMYREWEPIEYSVLPEMFLLNPFPLDSGNSEEEEEEMEKIVRVRRAGTPGKQCLPVISWLKCELIEAVVAFTGTAPV